MFRYTPTATDSATAKPSPSLAVSFRSADALALIHGQLTIEEITFTEPPALTSPLSWSGCCGSTPAPMRAVVWMMSTLTAMAGATSKFGSEEPWLAPGALFDAAAVLEPNLLLTKFFSFEARKPTPVRPSEMIFFLISSSTSLVEVLPTPAWAEVPMVVEGITKIFMIGTISWTSVAVTYTLPATSATPSSSALV